MVKKALLRAAFLYMPFFAMVGYVALVSLMINPGLNPSLSFPFMVDQLLPPVVKGVAIVSLLSVLMSSADSFLHVAGIMFTNDVLDPLLKTKLSNNAKLLTARLSTLLIGAIAVGVALFVSSMYEILLISYAFWTPAIVIPLIATILGKKATNQIFLISGISGIAAYLVWEIVFANNIPIDGIVPGFLVSASIFAIMFFFEKSKTKRSKPSNDNQNLNVENGDIFPIL